MQLRTLLPSLASFVLILVSCSEKTKPAESALELTPVDTTGTQQKEQKPPSTTPAFDSSQADKLWSLAPTNTAFGVVLTPGTGSRLHSMMMELVDVIEARPYGVALLTRSREAAKESPVDFFDAKSIEEAGISLSGGAALFIIDSEHRFLVLPIHDRAAFRKLARGTETTIDGQSFDEYKKLICTPKSDRYLCASTVDELTDFGAQVSGALSKQVQSLATQYRGDIEFAADVAQGQINDSEFAEELREVGDYVDNWGMAMASIRASNGAITVRMKTKATAKGLLAVARSVDDSLTQSALKNLPTGLHSLRVPTEILLAQLDGDTTMLPGPKGLRLKEDIVANMTGEILIQSMPGTSPRGRLAIGLKDTTPFKQAVNLACALIPATQTPGVQVTPGDSRCDIRLDMGKIPLPDPKLSELFDSNVTISVEVGKHQLFVTVGNESPNRARTPEPAALLEGKDWNLILWFTSLSLISLHIPSVGPIDDDQTKAIAFAQWISAHLHSLGVAGGIKSDGFEAIVHISTYAADSDAPYRAYQAAVTKRMETGRPLDITAIEKQWPNSRAAQIATSPDASAAFFALLAGGIAWSLFSVSPEPIEAPISAP